MTTARDIVEDAAAEIGELATDTPLSSADAERILRRLNRMLSAWATERLMIYVRTQETLTLVAGTASYSSTGLSGGRPVRVDSAFVRIDGADYPLTIATDAEYQAIPNKTVQATPEAVYPRMSYPNATFYFYPVPSEAMTCYLTMDRELTSTLSLSTSFALPPGYEEAVVANLAVLIAPMFGTSAKEETVLAARQGKARLKAANYVPIVATLGLPGGSAGSRTSIYEG